MNAADEVLAQADLLGGVTIEVDPAALGDLALAGGATADRLLWARHDLAFVADGRALKVPLGAPWTGEAAGGLVERALAAVRVAGDRDVPEGVGPLAMGALPYDPRQPGKLTVPRLVVCHRGDRAWATLVAPGQPTARDVEAAVAGLLADGPESEGGPEAPDGFELSASLAHREWKALVERTVEVLDAGELDKVVMARRVDVVANRPVPLPVTLARLVSLYPSCTVFHVEGFIGASPELLVRRSGYEVASHPLAGTIARSGNAATDDALVEGLLASPKERAEHAMVVDEIVARLNALCAAVEVPSAPTLMMLRNVSHLGTPLRGKLADRPGGEASLSALQLVAALHPTPAVGGLPVGPALEWQRAHEGFDRGRYAGPVGWVDARGDGEWVLGVRSAQVDGAKASLFAGNGIVRGSRPDAELAETQLKLQALLAALVRP